VSDDLTKRGPQDRKLISLTEDWEVRYWTETLGVEECQLREAIRQANSRSVEKVREQIRRNFPAEPQK
jgi:hypothetical protein